MTRLLFDDNMLTMIRVVATTDPALHKAILPPRVVYFESKDLHYFDDKLYVPNDPKLIEDILYEFHNTTSHPNDIRTLTNVCHVFCFPRMAKIIKRYYKKCITCERNKVRTTPKSGLNSPLPIPTRPWEYISMDFITNLPKVNGNEAIVTFVDRFTKQAHFIPCTMKINIATTYIY